MIDFRPIFFFIGMLLTMLALGMCIPVVIDALAGNPDWKVFAGSASVTLFVGITLILSNRVGKARFTVRQAFVLTTFSWLVMACFAALPFVFADLKLSYTDAFFEAMSGITTTGSTVITGLDSVAPGILLWRAILQWLGGIGVVIMAIGVFPTLGIGGMQIFRMEYAEHTEKVLPRAAELAVALFVIYGVLTLVCTLSYWAVGMSGFDAVAHAMTTISTGGFSPYDASIGHFVNPAVEWVATVNMIIGSLPFLIYLKMVRGDARALVRDTQVQSFFAIVGLAVVFVAGWLWLENGEPPERAIRWAAFNVVSIITGTGYTSENYAAWGSYAVIVFFFIMLIGGCAGSTTCGIKVFRFQVLAATTWSQIRHLVQPRGVFVPHYNRAPIPDSVVVSVLSFFFVFVVCLTLLALSLAMMGLDFLTAISSAATAIANVGPGLGDIVGPAGNFSSLPDGAKWLMSTGMLLGRLELFTVLVLFTPMFWRY